MATIPEQCLRCGAPDPTGAVTCARCREPLAIDLSLDHIPDDERTRFAIAKLVTEFGAPAPSFSELRNRFRLGDPRILAGVARSFAQRVQDGLAANGISTTAGRALPKVSAASLDAPAPGSGRRLYLSLSAIIALILIVAIVRQPPVLRAIRRNIGVFGLSSEQIAKLGEKSIATVSCEKRVGVAVFTDYDTLLGNAHVTCPNGSEVSVQLKDGTTLVGKVAARDDDLDVARITVPMQEQVTPMPIGDSTLLSPGEAVTFFDVTADAAPTAHVAKLDNEFLAIMGVGYFPLIADAMPGNSGGPLINRAGEVVGIAAKERAKSGTRGLMLPIPYANALLSLEPSASERRRWERFTARVEELDKQEATAIAARIGEPVLAAADINSNGVLFAVLMLRSETPPKLDSLNLDLSIDGTGPCHLPTRIVRWMSLKEAAAADSANRRLLKWFEHRGLSQGVYWGVGTPDTQFCTEIARATRASLRLGEGLSGLSEISLDLVRLRAARPASVPGSTVTSAAYEEVVRLEQRLAEMDKQREVLLVRARGLGDGAREAEQSLQVLDSNIASTRDRLQSLRSAH